MDMPVVYVTVSSMASCEVNASNATRFQHFQSCYSNDFVRARPLL